MPERLSADNVVDWALNRIYVLDATRQDQRKATLADIAQAVWQRVLTGQASPLPLAHALGRALREGHVVAHHDGRIEGGSELVARVILGRVDSINHAHGDHGPGGDRRARR